MFDFQASNPGQFDNDIDNVWQKGHTSESVFHTVGLLVPRGGIKTPHCHVLIKERTYLVDYVTWQASNWACVHATICRLINGFVNHFNTILVGLLCSYHRSLLFL